MTVASATGQVVAAVVAGGQGTRLGGCRKGQLTIGGRTILERQLAVLRPLFPRILLVSNDAPDEAEALVAPDVFRVADRGPPGLGPLAGIDAVLSALRAHEQAAVCVAGDMPFLHPAVLTLLRDHPSRVAALVASAGGHPEPLCARYTRACGPAVAAALATGHLRTAALLSAVTAELIPESALRVLDPALLTLENLNTPDDLARLEALAQAHGR